MGRPPSSHHHQNMLKKGPWTPEEDIILVSYIQEHGPGNWKSIPPNTGLLRCSKSCRLRWTNYLRPGIKRGNFSDQEDRMIIHLQALLGNRWAAIASYLPERTDNDIKNYWNNHLSKKLRKLDAGPDSQHHQLTNSQSNILRGQWERTLQEDIQMAKQALHAALSVDHHSNPVINTNSNSNLLIHHHEPLIPRPPSAASYASSTQNISRLLRGWMNQESRRSGHHSYLPAAWSMANGSSPSEDHEGTLSYSSYSEVSQPEENTIGQLTPETHHSHCRDHSMAGMDLHDHEAPALNLIEKWLLEGGLPTADDLSLL
ncbi:hypothetical protein SAY86_025313 [Trapa natans]|uniref:Uncharacterized protein n=1 Tax=Trapa natans TaxID=22666 RepID=A0AAN7M0I6_TRANT|nr:hypothetical protein SAY86_025313 [Trapa natans]